MRSMTSGSGPTCPDCGNGTLPEFSAPPGMAVCPRCGSLLRRSTNGMIHVGVSSDALVRAVTARMREQGLANRLSEEDLRDRVSAWLRTQALPADLDLDSLDTVELILVLEEEFGLRWPVDK